MPYEDIRVRLNGDIVLAVPNPSRYGREVES